MSENYRNMETAAPSPLSTREEGSDLFDVFLSYRRSDGSRFAQRLRRRLLQANQRIPGQAAPLRVYLDRIQARADSDFYNETIRPALLGSRWLIFVATPDAAKRPEGETDLIAKEIGDFIAHRGLDKIRVIHARGPSVPELPHDLVAKTNAAQEIDLRGLFHLLPSARAQEDWESLLATLFALNSDQMPLLRKEEERRQLARLSRLAGGIIGAAIFATGLSGYAIYQTAKSREDVERAAAVLASNFDPYQTGACDALDALWSNGATRKAVPAMQCRIARADFHWFNDNRSLARNTLGTWEDFTKTLPDLGPDLAEELANARHLLEVNRINYDHFEVTNQWLGSNEPLPSEGRATSLRAIEEVERVLDEVNSLDAARENLTDVLWPLITLIEDANETDASLALMKRAAEALEPHAKFSIETVGTPNDPWLLDYGLLARRIAYYSEQAGNRETAHDWSERALRAFGAFEQSEPWPLYQHGLAWMVHGQVKRASRQDPAEDFSKALDFIQTAVAVADSSWNGLREAKDALAYLRDEISN